MRETLQDHVGHATEPSGHWHLEEWHRTLMKRGPRQGPSGHSTPATLGFLPFLPSDPVSFYWSYSPHPSGGHLLSYTSVSHVESTAALPVSGSLAPRCKCDMCLRVCTHPVFIAQPAVLWLPLCGHPAHCTRATWPSSAATQPRKTMNWQNPGPFPLSMLLGAWFVAGTEEVDETWRLARCRPLLTGLGW